MARCQARIIKLHKRAKDLSVPPNIHSELRASLPVCGGILTLKAEIELDYGYGGCSCQVSPSKSFELEVTCSRCQSPWHEHLEELRHDLRHRDSIDVTQELDARIIEMAARKEELCHT